MKLKYLAGSFNEYNCDYENPTEESAVIVASVVMVGVVTVTGNLINQNLPDPIPDPVCVCGLGPGGLCVCV